MILKYFVFAFLFISSASSCAAPDCNNPMGQSEELYCAQLEYKKIDSELNSVYKNIKASLPKERFDLVLTSQKSWLLMRDSYCDALTYESKGTTGVESERTNCLANLTAERVKHLKQLED